MPGTYDLQGKFIADTYTHLMQKPDINKEEYYNGNGDQIIVINRDAIGTIKMFYPANGVLANYFDTSTGLPQPSTTYPDAAVWQGWALCDGQGGRPDLRGRFIVGYDDRTSDPSNGIWDSNYNTIGNSGGEKEHTLTVSEIPSHQHFFEYSRDGLAAADGSNQRVETINSSGQPPSDGQNAQTSFKGGGNAHENRPPYTVLVYVMRVS